MRRLVVDSMPLNELGRVIRMRLHADLPHPIVQRVHVAAAGNPFYALEVAREILRHGVPAAGEALPVPQDLTDLLRSRVAGLPRTTRKALLVAASTSRPTLQLVRAASGLGDRMDSALARAESAGMVHPGGEAIRFAHPLLASAVYASATSEERRTVHGQLADHVDHPEERARHWRSRPSRPTPRSRPSWTRPQSTPEAGAHRTRPRSSRSSRAGSRPPGTTTICVAVPCRQPSTISTPATRRCLDADGRGHRFGPAGARTSPGHLQPCRHQLDGHQSGSGAVRPSPGGSRWGRGAPRSDPRTPGLGGHLPGRPRRGLTTSRSVDAAREADHRLDGSRREHVHLWHGRVPDGSAAAGPHVGSRSAPRSGTGGRARDRGHHLHRFPDQPRTPTPVVWGPFCGTDDP